MELHQLHTFATAAELESFTRAAQSLAVTQPAVSQQVAGLEKELGISLFQRAGRSVRLTEAGRRFYGYTRRALDLLEDARHDVGGTQATVCGTLHIATCTTPHESLLPDLLARFHELYPEVRETVTVSDTSEATIAVETGEADVGIVAEQPHDTRLRAQAISCIELVLVAAPTHPIAGEVNITTSQLCSVSLIIRQLGSASRRCVERALQEAGVSLDDLTIAMEMNSNEAIRLAVQQGAGVAFLPPSAVQREIAEGELIAMSVAGIQPRLHFYVITDTDRMPTSSVRALLALIEH